ncbi:hypothetical protein TCON_1622 [Astathelohania contejeani]|uniref:Uncharacterized protein n=1 Tax=Astathelohania contejeani TaxID=164912 RepID=A0ABQ7HYC7_9MICR|nr:hypothetical protein TCON_1622 [Thelohania contejeani]
MNNYLHGTLNSTNLFKKKAEEEETEKIFKEYYSNANINEKSHTKSRKSQTTTATATAAAASTTTATKTTAETTTSPPSNNKKNQYGIKKLPRQHSSSFVKTAAGFLSPNDAYNVHRDGQMKNEKTHINRDIYIDDYDLEQETRLARVERRLQYIEECLGKSNIIKAEPITALIYAHESTKFTMNKVYQNWIGFMGHVAQQLTLKTIENLFGVADQFLFDGWFENKKNSTTPFLKVIFIDFEEDTTKVNLQIIKLALEYDRDSNNKRLYPYDCEYIHLYFDSINNTVYIIYSIKELQNIYKEQNIININHDQSVVSGLDTYSIMPGTDKRYTVLGSHRILYNTYLNISNGEMFNTNLQGMGMSALNICVILTHAMIHLKCLLEKNIIPTEKMRHSNKHFIEEILNYVPSTLYGHPLLPIITVPDH